MKRKIVLGLSVLVFLLFFFWAWTWQSSRVMDAPVLSRKAAENIQSARSLFEAPDSVELRISGVAVPYERTEERYYISKNMEEDYWKGTLDAFVDETQVSVAWIEDEAFGDIRSAIAGGHEFSCLIYSSTEYQKTGVN